MTVTVSFFKPTSPGAAGAAGVGFIRVRETIAIPGSTTATAEAGEYVVVLNEEASAVLVAHGTTPDAAAAAATSVTTAGFPVEAGAVSPPIVPATGSKINVKDVP
jgi:hypothetical protein